MIANNRIEITLDKTESEIWENFKKLISNMTELAKGDNECLDYLEYTYENIEHLENIAIMLYGKE